MLAKHETQGMDISRLAGPSKWMPHSRKVRVMQALATGLLTRNTAVYVVGPVWTMQILQLLRLYVMAGVKPVKVLTGPPHRVSVNLFQVWWLVVHRGNDVAQGWILLRIAPLVRQGFWGKDIPRLKSNLPIHVINRKMNTYRVEVLRKI